MEQSIRRIEGILECFDGGRLSRRQAASRLAAVLATAGGAGVAAASEREGPLFSATGVDHLALRVTDVERSRDFYRQHLGLSVLRDRSPSNCFLGCGRDFVALFRASSPGLDHYSYSVDGYDATSAFETLRSAGLSPRRSEDRVYFDDPDGIEVQVSAPGSGLT